jgi:hypothetical protein
MVNGADRFDDGDVDINGYGAEFQAALDIVPENLNANLNANNVRGPFNMLLDCKFKSLYLH